MAFVGVVLRLCLKSLTCICWLECCTCILCCTLIINKSEKTIWESSCLTTFVCYCSRWQTPPFIAPKLNAQRHINAWLNCAAIPSKCISKQVFITFGLHAHAIVSQIFFFLGPRRVYLAFCMLVCFPMWTHVASKIHTSSNAYSSRNSTLAPRYWQRYQINSF